MIIKNGKVFQEDGSYKFVWVKGHSSNPYNEECDRLAVLASKDVANFGVDINYERG